MKKMTMFEVQMEYLKQFLIDNPTKSAGLCRLGEITVYYGDKHPKAVAGRKEAQ